MRKPDMLIFCLVMVGLVILAFIVVFTLPVIVPTGNGLVVLGGWAK